MAPIPQDDEIPNGNNGPPPRTQPPRRRHKQLSTDSLNWGIPHNHDATRHVQEQMGDDSWRYKIIKILHGRRVQTLLAFLLLLDVLILFCELALLTLYPSCSLVQRDAISCCPILEEGDAGERLLAGADDQNKYFSCEPGLEPILDDNEATCNSHKWHSVHVAENALIIVTIIILTVFFIELNISMIALQPNIFFRQVFYAVDYFIVTVSLGLEVAFYSLGDEVLASLVGLVIMARIWRFLRISHGIVELAERESHDRHLREEIYTAELEKLLVQHSIPLPDFIPRDSSHGHTPTLLDRVHHKHLEKQAEAYRRQKAGLPPNDPTSAVAIH